MAIEEKQRALEFTYVPDNVEGELKYEISYDESKGMFPLTINTGGSDISYPLELFTEVVEFLTGKGVIESKILSRTALTPGTPSVAMATSAAPNGPSIPLPEIQRADGTPVLSANVDPLASFDITDGGQLPTPELVKKMPSGSPPIPKIVKKSEGVVVASTPVAPAFSPIAEYAPSPVVVTKEMINRPVIRSRISKGDPLSAERDASDLRAARSAASGKTIRKAHRVEGG